MEFLGFHSHGKEGGFFNTALQASQTAQTTELLYWKKRVFFLLCPKFSKRMSIKKFFHSLFPRTFLMFMPHPHPILACVIFEYPSLYKMRGSSLVSRCGLWMVVLCLSVSVIRRESGRSHGSLFVGSLTQSHVYSPNIYGARVTIRVAVLLRVF